MNAPARLHHNRTQRLPKAAIVRGWEKGVAFERKPLETKPFEATGPPDGEPGRGGDNREAPAWELDAIERARHGEQEAFGKLVEQYSARIYAHLFRLVRNREEAEDLTQETFLRAHRFLFRYDATRPFRNWLYTVATNIGLNALRSQRRRWHPVGGHLGGREALASGAGGSGAWEEPLSREEDGRQRVARGELEEKVSDAVDRLPPRSRLLIHMHYHEGMAIREIAEVLGMGESAAKTALHRARKSLREWLVEGQDE